MGEDWLEWLNSKIPRVYNRLASSTQISWLSLHALKDGHPRSTQVPRVLAIDSLLSLSREAGMALKDALVGLYVNVARVRSSLSQRKR